LVDTELATTVTSEQDLWRKRLAEAEARHREATDLLEERIAAGTGVESARAHKRATREEYLRVLRIFTDLVLRGKSPRSEA
jgi:hypothetical protein